MLGSLKQNIPLKRMSVNHPRFGKHSAHLIVCENLKLHLQLPGHQLFDEVMDSYLLTEVKPVLDV